MFSTAEQFGKETGVSPARPPGATRKFQGASLRCRGASRPQGPGEGEDSPARPRPPLAASPRSLLAAPWRSGPQGTSDLSSRGITLEDPASSRQAGPGQGKARLAFQPP